jgi:hypothetical protein
MLPADFYSPGGCAQVSEHVDFHAGSLPRRVSLPVVKGQLKFSAGAVDIDSFSANFWHCPDGVVKAVQGVLAEAVPVAAKAREDGHFGTLLRARVAGAPSHPLPSSAPAAAGPPSKGAARSAARSDGLALAASLTLLLAEPPPADACAAVRVVYRCASALGISNLASHIVDVRLSDAVRLGVPVGVGDCAWLSDWAGEGGCDRDSDRLGRVTATGVTVFVPVVLSPICPLLFQPQLHAAPGRGEGAVVVLEGVKTQQQLPASHHHAVSDWEKRMRWK